MSESVVRFPGSEESERRALFVQAVAQSYDRYVKDFGQEPEAIAYIMGGVFQPSRTAWEMHGDSRRGSTSFLAMAALHLASEVTGESVTING